LLAGAVRRQADADELAHPAAVAPFDAAVDHGEQGVVLAEADVFAGLVAGAALAHDDGAAGTVWPPKTFTPSRLDWNRARFWNCLSPFLCAIRFLPGKRDDFVDLHRGVVLPVADGPLVLLLALELEDDDLLGAVLGFWMEAFTLGVGGGSAPVARSSPSSLPMARTLSNSTAEPGSPRGFSTRRAVAGGDAILLTACFDHCVHSLVLLADPGIGRRWPRGGRNYG
jgi:hypothetical protein